MGEKQPPLKTCFKTKNYGYDDLQQVNYEELLHLFTCWGINTSLKKFKPTSQKK